MGRHLHFDCFNGISGDMTLGALADLGLDIAELERRLSGLPIGEFHLRSEKIKRSGIVGVKVDVEVREEPSIRSHHHRQDQGAHEHTHHHAPHLKDIIAKVEAAELGERATGRAIAAYRLIAEAEARVHGSTPEKIHFHEVGAHDAIVDIAGAMLGVEMLGIESFSMGAVALGNGTVECAHGVMPVPAPATAEIVKGLPIRPTEIDGELTTPTGAAILKVLAGDPLQKPPPMKIVANGYGGGSRRIEGHPNYLRLILGETEEKALPVDHEEIVILETEIDDLTPEVTGHLMETLLEAGARDVQFSPVQMKKNRPGQRIRVLALPADSDRLGEMILRETSTFGLRALRADRLCLRRRREEIQTALGPIQVKVGLWGGDVLKVSPEYESCRRIAAESGRPLREVHDMARQAIQEIYFQDAAPSRDRSN